MIRIVLAAALGFSSTCIAARADAPPTCTATAQGKKLAGAAMNSFMTKCKTDATTACTATAADKKLAGAAKTSFTNKCVSDAVGG
jgi:hypothetical protein